MLDEISSSQLTEWMAFAQLEPFGFKAEMYGHAVTASTIANVNRRKGRKPFNPEDFMPAEKTKKTAGSFIQTLKAMLGVNDKGQS